MQAVSIRQGSTPYSAANPAPASALFLDDNTPIPQLTRPGELLVRVHAATVTRDELAWPETYGPNDKSILGHDFAGEVVDTFDQTGTGLTAGDHVYGMTAAKRAHSTWAQFAVVQSAEAARKPASLDWASAATVPMSALTAWQALFVHAGVPEPDLSNNTTRTASKENPRRLLVTGASGAVGSYLVQLGALTGLHVTAASRSKTENADFLHSLGADEIVEYEELLGKENEFDVVTDTVGGQALESCWRLVRDGGSLITVDSSSLGFMEELPKNQEEKAKREKVKARGFIVEADGVQLQKIAVAVDLGLLKTFVAQIFPIWEASEAYEVGGRRLARRGKIVLSVAE
ncbi:putative alcohol dehydrogenase [Aspergillus heteromorphus CBS 117.55]|uniref:Putative alcohol dehydrogenase n=1 Tax=Aspergillus heteromorphus CBS 117.55 TaxID=1448321 RepID=A0A317WEE6_9EURO|nr:putative alcohol dehydrogenase [Aspergillus heteromorphus CBS 117.55]PWY83617.1 putative alcohol dehydrogenase [Aspergillus heteromorphus CBS 117.55]